jgi:hypothetical protein
MRSSAHLAVISLLFSLAACGSDPSSEPSEEEAAPVISELRYAPRETRAGARTIVVGSIRVEEADAEVTELAIEVTPPGASRPIVYPPTALPSGQALANGTVELAVSFVPPVAGDYTFAVRAVDAKGHASNPLTGTVHAR